MERGKLNVEPLDWEAVHEVHVLALKLGHSVMPEKPYYIF